MTRVQETKGMLNTKVSVDAKKEELNITISLKGYSVEELLNANLLDLVKYPRTGTDENGICKETGKPKVKGNLKVASTNGIIKIDNPKWENICFQVNTWSSEKVMDAKFEDKKRKEEAQSIYDELNAPKKPVAAPVGDDMAILKALVSANPALIATLTPEQQQKLFKSLVG